MSACDLPTNVANALVDEHVSPVEILDEDRVWRGFDHCLQNVEAVGDRHQGNILPPRRAKRLTPPAARRFAPHDRGTRLWPRRAVRYKIGVSDDHREDARRRATRMASRASRWIRWSRC
jgi:hypothetical protein